MTSYRPLSSEMNSLYRANEETYIPNLIKQIALTAAHRKSIKSRARELVEGVRKQKIKALSVENFLQTYDLGSQEGLALMCLAEAYLRVPDEKNQTALIRDKIGSVSWGGNVGKADSLVMNLATLGLATTDSLLKFGLDHNGFIGAVSSVTRKLSEPVIRQAIGHAMKILGQQFVLGETIEDALKRAQRSEARGYRHSYDMLGEGAKTQEDADHYFQAYSNAITAISTQSSQGDIHSQPSISVKLTALHPRYELSQKDRVFAELYPLVLKLCVQAKECGVALTIDAEETERLEISLELIEKLCQEKSLKGWNGLGLAVQAYQKRAPAVIDWLSATAKTYDRRFCVRLVKGAYWDTEIKRAQERGLEDYPVYTRKPHTDISYTVCAQKMFEDRSGIYPQFATHNAYTVALIVELSKLYHTDFEFQRLHGMGEQLHQQVVDQDLPCRIYAPVGQHRDLLAYLVRRLLENGANSSFVNRIYDSNVPIDDLLKDPIENAESQPKFHHPNIPLPNEMFMPHHQNSKGLDLSNQETIQHIESFLGKYQKQLPHTNTPLINGIKSGEREILILTDPADPSRIVSRTHMGTVDDIQQALQNAEKAFPEWSMRSVTDRAALLDNLAAKLEENYDELLALLVYEGGKTFADAVSEIREATDFCRYYATQARLDMGRPTPLPGPTGEVNELSLHGRGIVACISPWNFPLAIFLGQITAALVAGNCVISKPAQQTPSIARKAMELAHEAGIPKDVLQLIPAKGSLIGNALLTDPRIAGVAFTGSTEVAWTINQTLAARQSIIAPLIAETGGINAMIVDSSALPEQVVNDVIISAFQSAGQRCSALRLLYLQDDIADQILKMLKGALQELKLGHTSSFSTDIGPVIDASARKQLLAHVESLRDRCELIAEAPCQPGIGHFVAPQAWLLRSADLLNEEVFGPILHVVRFKGKDLQQVVEQINGKGYGLTLGLHSRIDETIEYVRQHARVGNFYVNRSMIGAVVGVQPFGGEGLSGTGPKAGGPHYLHRFTVERTYTRDTTAAGGNASLLASA